MEPSNTLLARAVGLQAVDAAEALCDLAVIARPAAEVPRAMDECGARGIRYAILTPNFLPQYPQEPFGALTRCHKKSHTF